MKRRNLLLVFVAFLLALCFAGCTEEGGESHDHTFGEWTITVAPTESTEGKVEKVCECGRKVTIKLPTLTNELVWTLVDSKEATYIEDGFKKYESTYGTVELVLPQLQHVYGEWVITQAPSYTEEGEAKRDCSCGEPQVVTLPVLSDETVWSVHEFTDSTCAEEGHAVLISVYGKVNTVVELKAHTYSEWSTETDPTLEEVGSQVRTCTACQTAKDYREVPVLTDEEVWTKTDEVYSTYTEFGSMTFESEEYGEVVYQVAKKDAPFYNTTYHNFALDPEDNDKVVQGYYSAELAWKTASVTVDNEAKGSGEAYPFRNEVTFRLVDPSGKMVVTNDGTSYNGYVDFATGIIVRARYSTYRTILVLTPYGEVSLEQVKSAAWAEAIAFTYTYGEQSLTAIVHHDVVYFGVTFKDETGAVKAVDELLSCNYIYAYNAEGEKVCGYVKSGEAYVEADGIEGTYTQGEDQITFNGCGGVTYKGATGTYTLSENVCAVYVGGAYYDVTLNVTEKTCEIVKPMVTIEFNTLGKAEVAAQSVNKNIAFALPEPTNVDFIFRGWYYDAEYTQAVAEEFVPTVNVTLFAKWAPLLVINLSGVMDGDATQIRVGEGDVIGQYLPAYDDDTVNERFFAGWYLDAEFTQPLPEEAVLSLEDEGMTVYAKWTPYPAYYGSYKGSEVWGKNSNSTGKSLTITKYGKISGTVTGDVVSYDPETQVVNWVDSNNKARIGWYDVESGVFVTDYYKNTYISSDFYIFAKGTDAKIISSGFALTTPPLEGTASDGYFARFLDVKFAEGVKTIFVYFNRIHSNVTITDTLGNELNVSKLSSSKTVVVKNATTGEVIFAAASQGANFGANQKINNLDAFYGTYTCGESTVVLSGTGEIQYNGKTGTYALAPEGSTYGFDVYLENNTEYYELTLDGQTATMHKAMVTVSFVTGEGHNPVEAVSVNKNVAYTLPVLSEENYVFNGWFAEATFETALGATLTPSQDTTVYAKFSDPAVLTIVYNNGEENGTVVYSVGDVAEVEKPEYAKHAFRGWFTTPTFEEGTEWTSGTVINADLTIYAKWEDAPAFNNTYLAIELEGTKAEGGKTSKYSRTAAILNVDPDGHAVCSGYPFTGNVTVTYTDEASGAVKIEVVSSTSSKFYNGYIHKPTGFIVITFDAGQDATYEEVMLLDPFQKTSTNPVRSSYWNSGKSRVISYTFADSVFYIYIENNTVYFDVKVENKAGEAFDCDYAHTENYVAIKTSAGELISEFGHNGTCLTALDGLQGTYTNGTETLTLDGIEKAVLNGVEGTYSAAAEGSTYTLDVYTGGYYEVTLDQANKTFTSNKPMVTVTFASSDYATIEPVQANKNIALELPEPTHESYVFLGWYLDAEFTQAVADPFIPTANVTLYGKWAEKVVLTLVIGNGYENVTINLYKGQTFNLSQYAPGYTNGQSFKGWFADATCETPFTSTSIEANTTVYAKWEAGAAYTLTGGSRYAFTYDQENGYWKSTNKGINSSECIMTLTALGTITVDLKFWASGEKNYDYIYIEKGSTRIHDKVGDPNHTEANATTASIELNEGEVLKIVYRKDSSTHKGEDTGYIKVFNVNGTPVTAYTE